jgi:hypothetical protein
MSPIISYLGSYFLGGTALFAAFHYLLRVATCHKTTLVAWAGIASCLLLLGLALMLAEQVAALTRTDIKVIHAIVYILVAAAGFGFLFGGL